MPTIISSETVGPQIGTKFNMPSTVRFGNTLLMAFCSQEGGSGYSQVKVYRSTDGGSSWSRVLLRASYNVSSVSCSGASLVRTSTGRICLMYHQFGPSSSWNSHITTCYSDDNGTTWSASTDINTYADTSAYAPEGAMVHVPQKGTNYLFAVFSWVYFNFKTAYSTDGGATWTVRSSQFLPNITDLYAPTQISFAYLPNHDQFFILMGNDGNGDYTDGWGLIKSPDPLFSTQTTVYSSTGSFSMPMVSGMTLGPDNQLWFIADSVLYRINTTGGNTGFSVSGQTTDYTFYKPVYLVYKETNSIDVLWNTGNIKKQRIDLSPIASSQQPTRNAAVNVDSTTCDLGQFLISAPATEGTIDTYIRKTASSPYNTVWIPVSYNQQPSAPTHSNISSSGYTINRRPKFFLSVSDPDAGNTITNAQIQVSTVSNFASTIANVQYGSDSGYGTTTAGWSELPTSSNTTATIAWTPQADLNVATLYARARTKDSNGAWSDWGTTQTFTVSSAPWSDTPSGPGLKAQWMNDLATVINAALQFRGLSTATFTDGTITTSTDMKPIHISERRMALSSVLSVAGASASWTDPSLTNIITQNQATGGDWLSSTTGFSVFGQQLITIARDTSTYYSGSGSIRGTSMYAGSQDAGILLSRSDIPTVASTTHTLYGLIKGTSGRTCDVLFNFYNSSGTLISTVNGGTLTLTGGWDTAKGTALSPANTASVEIRFTVYGMVSGERVWLDSCLLAHGNLFNVDRSNAHITELRAYCTQT